jgi:hypothetical protein
LEIASKKKAMDLAIQKEAEKLARQEKKKEELKKEELKKAKRKKRVSSSGAV